MTEFIAAIIAALVAWSLAWVTAHDTVAAECELLGGFYVGKQVYECRLQENPNE
jgi:hypothetical protein